MGNTEKYKYTFTKQDACRWLKRAIKHEISIQKSIRSEFPNTDEFEKYEAAFGFFCRAYFLMFSDENQELEL